MPETYLESRVLTADPVELIQILYEHAIQLVQTARAALAAGDIVGRSKAISRTIGVLGELEGSLDQEAGGAIGQNLAALYRYMRTRLMVANLKQEDGPLAEVESLMQTLAGAWQTISRPPLKESANEAAEARVTLESHDGRFLHDTNSTFADHSWSA